MSCDVGKVTEGLGIALWVGEVTESLENELCLVVWESQEPNSNLYLLELCSSGSDRTLFEIL